MRQMPLLCDAVGTSVKVIFQGCRLLSPWRYLFAYAIADCVAVGATSSCVDAAGKQADGVVTVDEVFRLDSDASSTRSGRDGRLEHHLFDDDARIGSLGWLPV